MEWLKEWIKQVMLNEYVKNGRVLTFQQIQNILISKGFSYYVNAKDGKKKVRIRKAIYPRYQYVKKSLRKFKKQRDDAVSVLNCLIGQGVEKAIVRKVYKELEGYLTTEDREYFREKLNQKKNTITF